MTPKTLNLYSCDIFTSKFGINELHQYKFGVFDFTKIYYEVDVSHKYKFRVFGVTKKSFESVSHRYNF